MLVLRDTGERVMVRDRVIFQFYPTWMCNFKCPYCIVENSPAGARSMFDCHDVNEWCAVIQLFGEKYDIELSISGGDPLMLEESFSFLSEVASMPFVKYIRVDHNMSKVE